MKKVDGVVNSVINAFNIIKESSSNDNSRPDQKQKRLRTDNGALRLEEEDTEQNILVPHLEYPDQPATFSLKLAQPQPGYATRGYEANYSDHSFKLVSFFNHKGGVGKVRLIFACVCSFLTNVLTTIHILSRPPRSMPLHGSLSEWARVL